jgi:hypothetical protein
MVKPPLVAGFGGERFLWLGRSKPTASATLFSPGAAHANQRAGRRQYRSQSRECAREIKDRQGTKILSIVEKVIWSRKRM